MFSYFKQLNLFDAVGPCFGVDHFEQLDTFDCNLAFGAGSECGWIHLSIEMNNVQIQTHEYNQEIVKTEKT